MNDKDKITALISLLGEENANRIKEKVADFIIEAMQDDICDYNRERYILNPVYEKGMSFYDFIKFDDVIIKKIDLLRFKELKTMRIVYRP